MDKTENKSNSRQLDSEILLSALHELHREVDRRRTYLFRSMTAFAAFCGLALGWVFSSSTKVEILGVLPVLLFILFVTFVGGFKAWGAVVAQSESAKTIVRISEELGLYNGYYPDNWKNWGSRKEGWNVMVLCFLGLATCFAISARALTEIERRAGDGPAQSSTADTTSELVNKDGKNALQTVPEKN